MSRDIQAPVWSISRPRHWSTPNPCLFIKDSLSSKRNVSVLVSSITDDSFLQIKWVWVRQSSPWQLLTFTDTNGHSWSFARQRSNLTGRIKLNAGIQTFSHIRYNLSTIKRLPWKLAYRSWSFRMISLGEWKTCSIMWESWLWMKHTTWKDRTVSDLRFWFHSWALESESSCWQAHPHSHVQNKFSTWSKSCVQTFSSHLVFLATDTATQLTITGRIQSNTMVARTRNNFIICWKTKSWSVGWKLRYWPNCRIRTGKRSSWRLTITLLRISTKCLIRTISAKWKRSFQNLCTIKGRMKSKRAIRGTRSWRRTEWVEWPR